MKDKLHETINEIVERLSLKYKNTWIGGERVFEYGRQRFIVSGFHNNGRAVVVVEYGDQDTPRTQYEDGDTYDILEMSIPDIVNDIIHEVEDID